MTLRVSTRQGRLTAPSLWLTCGRGFDGSYRFCLAVFRWYWQIIVTPWAR